MTILTLPRSTSLLLALCLALAILVASELIADEHAIGAGRPSQPVEAHSIEPTEPEVLEFRPPSPSLVDVIVARSLFSPSRRPDVTSPAASDVEDFAFELTAVLLTDSLRTALVKIGDAEQPVWIRERAWLSSWQVTNILTDHLRLQRRNKVRIVNLQADRLRPE